jgi:hypothetical protein
MIEAKASSTAELVRFLVPAQSEPPPPPVVEPPPPPPPAAEPSVDDDPTREPEPTTPYDGATP